MGVTGLWRLVEPAGKPVPLETLENKVLAVDISIWLHQMVKGYQDSRGGAVANAHLLGLFQRLCKLMYHRIKPVFVFDGGIPHLKRQTIMSRQNKKSQMHSNINHVRQQLMNIILKQTAVKSVLSTDKESPTKRSPVKPSNEINDDQLFKLPPIVKKEEDSSSESDSETTSTKHNIDLHSIDVKSEYFKSLTPREKHDLLTELKETRKQSSWGRLHELPAHSDDFSDYQMNRLLKRRQVQVSLEEAEKEIGGHFLSINELEVLLNEEGISTKIEQLPTRRIASDDSTRFILIKDVREAIEVATKREATLKSDLDDKSDIVLPSTSQAVKTKCTDELGEEFDDDLKAAIELSLNTSATANAVDPSKESDRVDLTHFADDFIYDTDSDWSMEEESDDETDDLRNAELTLAKAYMLENSGLSEYEIMRIINTQKVKRKKSRKFKRAFRIKEDLPQVAKVKFIHDGEITTLDEECEVNNQNKIESHVPTHVLLKQQIGNEGKPNNVTPSTVINPVREPSINENIIISSDDDDRDTAIITEEKLDAISNPSSSDTDDSFEEVPESNSKNVTQPLLQLVINPEGVLEDDIFADVFQVTSKPKTPEPKSAKITLRKFDIVPEVNSIIYDAVPVHRDIISVEQDNPASFVVSTKTPLSDNLNSLVANETISIVDNLDTTPVTPPKESNDSIDMSNEQSPQKGMPLNKLRHLISQEESKFAEERESHSKTDAPIASQKISTEELSVLADDLEVQKDKLEKEHNKLNRMGRDISQEMTKDAQDLLQMFGIPYIVAPMEAEAQCAFLETTKLTDGTITDDSDIWLFGGKTVYKNFFNQQKYVLQFLAENIQQCFKLPREHLILFALLVGSDYTSGITGVGPVTALEILAAFPPIKTELIPPYVTLLAGLKKFRSWYSSSRTMGNSSLRNKLKNISLSDKFPNYRVVEAYLCPKVETSNEKFSWGKPDITAIREFTREKFGWSQDKTDAIVLPVLKRLDLNISQPSIRAFFRTDVKQVDAFDKMSKRVKSAVERMGSDNLIEDFDDKEGPSVSKKPKIVTEGKRKRMPKKKLEQKNANQPSPNAIQDVIQSPQVSTLNNDEQASDSSADTQNFSYPERHIERFPQREKDKNKVLQNKIKAIELFRTSKGGPGFVGKRKKIPIKLKEDAELSESSD